MYVRQCAYMSTTDRAVVSFKTAEVRRNEAALVSSSLNYQKEAHCPTEYIIKTRSPEGDEIFLIPGILKIRAVQFGNEGDSFIVDVLNRCLEQSAKGWMRGHELNLNPSKAEALFRCSK